VNHVQIVERWRLFRWREYYEPCMKHCGSDWWYNWPEFVGQTPMGPRVHNDTTETPFLIVKGLLSGIRKSLTHRISPVATGISKTFRCVFIIYGTYGQSALDLFLARQGICN
jgi:hypothetical protein